MVLQRAGSIRTGDIALKRASTAPGVYIVKLSSSDVTLAYDDQATLTRSLVWASCVDTATESEDNSLSPGAFCR
jgi:hypothetical protein